VSLDSLEQAAGAALVQHDPVQIDDQGLCHTLSPGDPDALAEALRLASQHAVALVPCGGRTRLELGNPPRDARVLLDMSGLHGVTEFDSSEGVCHVHAGTTLGTLREALRGSGWEVPLDAPDASSVGGALASNAIGPRCIGFGLPRDIVLGLSVVDAAGQRTRCGGRVVKNVTGYDMAKLYTGSLGTLAVIEGAWLRLRPTPEVVEVVELDLPGADAHVSGVEIARRHAVRACVLARSGEAYRCVVELAGDEASVRETSASLQGGHAARPASVAELDAVRRRQTEPSAGRMRFRIGTLPSCLGGVLASLARADVAHLAHPGLGLVYAIFESGQSQEAFRIVGDIAEGCEVCCEAASAERKKGHDVFGDLGGRLPLVRSLKERFDPHSLLNPGRFAGFL
jgi:glycolate oxidase FAD binding subunit